jgi:Flp pilus assembly pilin Flp
MLRHYWVRKFFVIHKKCSPALEVEMSEFFCGLWSEDAGQDIAEYAVMLAVILVLVVGTIRLIGSNANNAFSNVASSIQ